MNERELLSLDGMSVEKFRSVFGKDTRTRNRPYLVRKIAWRLQERAEGGLSDRAKARVAELAATAPLRHVAPRVKPTEEAESDGRDPGLPKPGTASAR